RIEDEEIIDRYVLGKLTPVAEKFFEIVQHFYAERWVKKDVYPCKRPGITGQMSLTILCSG
ncbi:MAG: hypothetical protein ACE5IR_22400, partial [bacterium]